MGVEISNATVRLDAGDLIGRDKYVGLDEAKVTTLFRRMLDSLPRGAWAASSDAEPVLCRFLAEKTEGFIGRRFLFDAFDRFCAAHPRGYFIVRGEPGVGKTSFAAELVKARGLANHFNIRAEGRSNPAAFVENICGQLIRRHELPVDHVPADAARDSTFLQYVLELVAAKLPEGERFAIVVDALDEADPPPAGVNPLNLPRSLPPGCFVLVTTRPHTRGPALKITCEQESFALDDDLAENQADIRSYLDAAADRKGVVAYRRRLGKSKAEFVGELAAASEGNFMYLRYVLPEIEAGRYRNKEIRELPVGLRQYYEDHWEQMRGVGGDHWFDTKVPVVAALTVVREPVSAELLARYSGVHNLARIHEVLREWAPFLEVRVDEGSPAHEARYRIYHASFHDFLAGMPEVAHLHSVESRITDDGLADYLPAAGG